MSTRFLPILLLFLIPQQMLSAEANVAQPSTTIAELLTQIKSYERLYQHVHLRARSVVESGHPVSQTDLSQEQLFLDGANQRWEAVSSVDGLWDARTTRVSNGTQVTEWIHRNGRDDGVIAPQDDANSSCPLHYAFRRFVNIDRHDERTLKIVEDNGSRITLRFETRPDRYLLATFERYGEYLRTISYQPFWIDSKTRAWTEGTSYFYEYAPWDSPTRASLAPVSFRRVTGVHTSELKMVIDHVDFDFAVTDDTFTLEFPKGCQINDQIRGIRFTQGVPEG